MSRQSRARKREISKKIRLIIFIFIILSIFFIIFRYYRSNQSQILKYENYLNAKNSQIYFIRDCAYFELNNFSDSSLSVPQGTKVSGYDQLTKTDLTVNTEYLNNQIQGISKLIDNKSFSDWDAYSLELQKVMASSEISKQDSIGFYETTALYAPESQAELEANRASLQALNTDKPTQITLNNLGIIKTGFVFSSISDYDKLACEAVLGSVSSTMLNDISRLSTDKTNALRIINNDHCYALASVSSNTSVQGEDKVAELKEKYKESSNSEYYRMLVNRVDRLRLYPLLSFNYNNKIFPVYLVDIVKEDNYKILVFMIKDYLQDLNQLDKLNASINVQDYKAWLVPQKSIIKKDNKTYVQLLEKGYFTHEIEVNIAAYDLGKAILPVSSNPDLSDGMTIKTYPS